MELFRHPKIPGMSPRKTVKILKRFTVAFLGKSEVGRHLNN